MTREEYIGEYVERHKKQFEGLEYGMEYLNILANLEAKAEKKWDKMNNHIPYQLCPKCNGTGKAMNHNNPVPTTIDICDVCKGKMIIPMYVKK